MMVKPLFRCQTRVWYIYILYGFGLLLSWSSTCQVAPTKLCNDIIRVLKNENQQALYKHM